MAACSAKTGGGPNIINQLHAPASALTADGRVRISVECADAGLAWAWVSSPSPTVSLFRHKLKR
jgi:hypothetical protein